MLEENGLSDKGGKDVLVHRTVEAMLFGVPPACGEDGCEGGHLHFDRTSGNYRCSGHTSGWSKCLYEEDQSKVVMLEFKLPDWARDNDVLKKWKYEKRSRVLEKSVIVRAEVTENMSGRSEAEIKAARQKRKFFEVGKKSEKPFEGYLIVLCGKLSATQKELTSRIEKVGGKVSAKCNASVTHVISTEATVKKGTDAKLEEADKFDIPILSEDWLDETIERMEILNQKDYLIGGTRKARQELKREFTNPDDEDKKALLKEQELMEKKSKYVLKGRCAVDPECDEDVIEQYHVLDHGNTEIYNVVLNVADVTTGVNSFYNLQLLEPDVGVKKRADYKVFRKWGRVGTKFGGKKTESFSSKRDALAKFEEVYLDKTGNLWEDRDRFEKKPGKFFPLQIDYSGKSRKKEAGVVDVKSKLDIRVQNLISLIFDVKVIEESLTEMKIDLKKMPLGNLSKEHIETGYEALREIDGILKDEKIDAKKKDKLLLAATNKFYTLIPHDFGTNTATVINTMEELQAKLKLMEALIDIEIAATLLKQEEGEGESIVDANYKKLNTALEPIDKTHDDFKWVHSYLNNQKGSWKAELIDVFRVDRNGDSEKAKTVGHLGNKQLLWHGSRVSNYVGILSQGLRIAPPEAPKSGYRFGKGIYFADICDKSIGYCRGAGSDYILMMLVEVTLGKQKELKQDQYMEKALPGSDSTKAMGAIAPESSFTLPDGVVVPSGKPKNTGVISSCMHNEYIVYTVPQATIKYLLKVKLAS